MHKYILEKEGHYIAGAGFNSDGVLELQMTNDRELALALHFKRTVTQLRRLIKKTVGIRFKVIKV